MLSEPSIEPVARTTIETAVSFGGLGAMTGEEIEVRLTPWDEGILFVRTDTGCTTLVRPSAATVGASWSAVGARTGEVRVVEHLLATLAGMEITDVVVSVSGPEVPLLDGSAAQWVELVQRAGRRSLGGTMAPVPVLEPIVIGDRETGQMLAAHPYPRWRAAYVLDWDHPLVRLQAARFEMGKDDFAAELGPARTFALAAEAEAARDAGLFPAGTEENLVVILDDRLSSEPTVPNAFARHKLVDLIGDLYTVGRPLAGLFVGLNSGHAMNHRLVRALASQGEEE